MEIASQKSRAAAQAQHPRWKPTPGAVITIPAMVRVGPWTLNGIVRDENWSRCERCKEPLKEIWICEVDDVDEAMMVKLEGKRTWRIGSTCGPVLLEVSKQVWKKSTEEAQYRLKLWKRWELLIQVAREKSAELPSWIYARGLMILVPTLPTEKLRHLGKVMAIHERRLGLRK